MKKLSLLICMVMVMGLLVACGSDKKETNPSPGASSSAPSSPSGEPKKNDKVYLIRASTPAAEGSQNHQSFLNFKEEVEQRSGGRIQVEIFAGGTLVGGNREEIEGAQRGDIAYISPSSAPFVSFVPSVAIFDLPFLFPSMEVAFDVANNSPAMDKIRKDMEDQGLILLGVIPDGFRHLTTKNKVVKTPDDLTGIKVRTMENKNHMSMWKALGANPTPISFGELYTALEQGTVDAQENPANLIFDQKFYETQKNLNLTGHILNTGMTVFSKKIYDSLPADLQQVVKEAATAAIAKSFQTNLQGEIDYIAKLRDVGMVITELSAEEKQVFQDKAKETVDMIAAEVGKEFVDALLADIKAASK